MPRPELLIFPLDSTWLLSAALFMEEAASATKGSMAAMIGGEEEDVRRLAADCDIDVANLNAPGQIVVSGTKEGIEKAVASAEEYGIRIAQELEVAGAYHSRLMMPAQGKAVRSFGGSGNADPKSPRDLQCRRT